MGRLGSFHPAFLFAAPLFCVRSSEAPNGVVGAFPQIAHQHASLGTAGLHNFTVADIDADVVNLVPPATAWAAEVLPKHQVAGLKLAPAHHTTVVVAPFGLSRSVGS